MRYLFLIVGILIIFPLGALEITEEELTILETALIESKKEIELSRTEIEKLSSILIEQREELTMLSTSYSEYVSEAEKIQENLQKTIQRKETMVKVAVTVVAVESLVMILLLLK